MTRAGRLDGPRPDATRARRRGLDQQRLLTIMHVDLVGSTMLAERLEPEDLRDVLLTYHDICERAVERYGGDIGGRAGDGLMVHFGLPRPHEDDASRAVLAGLAIVDAVAGLADEVGGSGAERLQVRVGVHSGLVVITEIGRRRDIVGSAANETARIEAAAKTGTVAVSNATRRLVGDEFEFVDTREVRLRGVSRPMVISTARRRSSAVNRPRPVLPFIGRSDQRTRLLDAWTAVGGAHDRGQYSALVVGEPGIGKSRLVDLVSAAAVRDGAHRVVLEHRSYDADIAFHAWESVILHELSLDRSAPAEARIEALTAGLSSIGLEASLPYVAGLIGLDGERLGDVEAVDPTHWREATAGALVGWIDLQLRAAPVVLVVEDLHWADPSTLNLLKRLVRSQRAGLMILMTSRERDHAWDGVDLIEIVPLSDDEIVSMGAGLVSQMALADEDVQRLVERSDGVPLYLERLFDLARRRELHADSAVPSGLDELLMSVVHGPDIDQPLLGLLATIGRRFDVDTVARCLDESESSVVSRLDDLCDLGILERVGRDSMEYRFHHALTQQAAYDTLLASDRRHLHERIAGVIEQQPTSLSFDAASIARHFDQAGRSDRAIRAYLRASAGSHRRGAAFEARRLVERARRLLDDQPPGRERDVLELEIQLQIARCVLATEGYGADASVVASRRAHELSSSLGDRGRRFQIEVDLYSFHALRGDDEEATEMLRAMRVSAEGDPVISVVADQMQALDLHRHGRFADAADRYANVVEQVAQRAERSPRHALGAPADGYVGALCDRAFVRWQLGEHDGAFADLERALERARGLDGPESAFSEGYARSIRGHLLLESGYLAEALETAEDAVAFCVRKGLTMWGGKNHMQRLIARAKLDPTADNATRLGRFVDRQRAMGTTTNVSYFLSEHAMVCAEIGQRDQALRVLDEALSIADRTGERSPSVEILRRRGCVRHASGDDPDGALADLGDAMTLAVDQSARVYGARTFIDLARLGDPHEIGLLIPDVDRMLASGPASEPTGVIAEALELLSRMEYERS